MGGIAKMAQYGLTIDLTRCNGCYNCFLACRDEFCGNDYPPYSAAQPDSGQFWMRLIENERGTYPKVKIAYIPVPCMHCKDAPCIKGSSNNAVFARPDGIVVIDPDKAIGQKELLTACPYRVIYWNEEKKIPQKCTFCAHLLEKGWKEPRCVEACPTDALVFENLEDPESHLSKKRANENLEVFHPEYGLETSVHYIGLPKRFIAGSVSCSDKEDEWPKNVTVTLIDRGTTKAVQTDNYGDFEFEGLEPDSECTLRIEYRGYTPRELTLKTNQDVYLGEIVLNPV
jgi:Fe-S-cluster-containing dehydrogenase component